MEASGYPPGMTEHDRVVLFDGVCKLCSFWAQFLIRHDKERRYKLATVQSEEGKAILAWCGLPTEHYDTLVLVEGNAFFVRSLAVIKVLSHLPFPWKLAAIALVFPRPLRDWAYDRIAHNRYRLFGKHQVCMIPTADHLNRFLNTK